ILDRLDLVLPLLLDRSARPGARLALAQRQEQVLGEVLERDAEALGARGEEVRLVRLRTYDLYGAHDLAMPGRGLGEDLRAFLVVSVFLVRGGHGASQFIASSLMRAVTMMLARASGKSSFQPRFMSWSARKRGSVHRIISWNQQSSTTLAPNASNWSSTTTPCGNGRNQPPVEIFTFGSSAATLVM